MPIGYEVDFLAVGKDSSRSGDAIALRYGNLSGLRSEQQVVVIDGGTKDSGGDLVAHVQKYFGTDRIDVVVSTHPDADHSSGLSVVLENMDVGALWVHLPWNHVRQARGAFQSPRVTSASFAKRIQESLQNVETLEELARRRSVSIVEPFTR